MTLYFFNAFDLFLACSLTHSLSFSAFRSIALSLQLAVSLVSRSLFSLALAFARAINLCRIARVRESSRTPELIWFWKTTWPDNLDLSLHRALFYYFLFAFFSQLNSRKRWRTYCARNQFNFIARICISVFVFIFF